MAGVVAAVWSAGGDFQERLAEHGVCAPHVVQSLDVLHRDVVSQSYALQSVSFLQVMAEERGAGTLEGAGDLFHGAVGALGVPVEAGDQARPQGGRCGGSVEGLLAVGAGETVGGTVRPASRFREAGVLLYGRWGR